MNYAMVLLVSAALGVDAFSVAVCIGLSGAEKRKTFTVTGMVTLFHILMPLLGLALGTYLGRVAGPFADAIGALILITIGISVIWGSFKEQACIDISKTASLILMALSVSLDALTVGFGLGALQVDVVLTVITMGLMAGMMTAFGLIFGKLLNKTFGEKAEITGGLILILIGIKLLL